MGSENKSEKEAHFFFNIVLILAIFGFSGVHVHPRSDLPFGSFPSMKRPNVLLLIVYILAVGRGSWNGMPSRRVNQGK